MSTAAPLIRAARPADAAAAARCHVACWREAYHGLVDPDLLAEALQDLGSWTDRWYQALSGGQLRYLAVAENGEVVGFASAGPGRDDDLDIATELYAIYVRQRLWGTGLAARLLRQALGIRDAYVWLLHNNARATAFYAREGFRMDGTEKTEPTFGIPEIRMVRTGGP
jgi:GNAT superfamily N-acetyltransferase